MANNAANAQLADKMHIYIDVNQQLNFFVQLDFY